MSNLITIVQGAQAVLFDLDETLVDSHSRHEYARQAFLDHYKAMGILTDEAYPLARRAIQGLAITHIHRGFLSHSSVTPEEAVTLFADKYDEAPHETPLFPYAIETLRYLHAQGKTVGGINAAHERLAMRNLQILRDAYEGEPFHTFAYEEPGMPVKPDRKTLQRLIKRAQAARRPRFTGAKTVM